MLVKTKIGISVLVIGAFIASGFALNAFDVDAFGWDKHKGNSEEWQAKMEEFKGMTPGARKEHREQCMESGDCMHPRGFINRNSEEWQAKIEELRANGPENGEWKGRNLGFGHFFGFRELKSDEVDYEVVNIANGVQLTITSDNSEIVEKLYNFSERIKNISE